MTWQGWVQIVLFVILVTASMKPLGAYIAGIVDGHPKMPRLLAAFEDGLYRLAGVDLTQEQSWVSYAFAVLCFHFFGIALLYLLQRLQNVLPLNPQQFKPVAPDLALNTAVSFATNTSWQSYVGETKSSTNSCVDDEVSEGQR